jgi:mannose-1-phosphate guanylyltransferase
MSGRSKALILAAGLGTRLRPVTETTPKCLVPIGGRPLLGYWFDALERAGIAQARVNTHHLPAQVEGYVGEVNARGAIDVSTSHEPVLLGSAGTIANNADYVAADDTCLIIYADNLSDVDLGRVVEFHRGHGDPFTMLLFHTQVPKQCGIATLDADQRIVAFVEKPEVPPSNLANAGVYVVTGAAYREIAELHAFDLGFDVLPRFTGRMRGLVHDGYHLDIGNLAALERARADCGTVFVPTVFVPRGSRGGQHA